jgi:hypothetical protein
VLAALGLASSPVAYANGGDQPTMRGFAFGAAATSNAVAFSLDYLYGRNQFGQLIEYDELNSVALGVSYYW